MTSPIPDEAGPRQVMEMIERLTKQLEASNAEHRAKMAEIEARDAAIADGTVILLNPYLPRVRRRSGPLDAPVADFAAHRAAREAVAL